MPKNESMRGAVPDGWRWPHVFGPEIACRCCGETYIWPQALDAFERLQIAMGGALVITSGHRCALHNARVGGAPMSLHKRLAFDVALVGHAPGRLLAAARAAGFTGFGFAQSFLHLDTRARPAHWFYGSRSKSLWTSVLSSAAPSAAGCSAFSATSRPS